MMHVVLRTVAIIDILIPVEARNVCLTLTTGIFSQHTTISVATELFVNGRQAEQQNISARFPVFLPLSAGISHIKKQIFNWWALIKVERSGNTANFFRLRNNTDQAYQFTV